MKTWKLLLGAAVFFAACADERAPVGRLDFLKAKDVTRAYVPDSAWDPVVNGFGVLDPPYDVGPNQLTVLRDLDQPDITVEQTLPLGAEGAIRSVELSPDGDTAIVTRSDPHAILVVRGLAVGSPYLDQTVPVPLEPNTVAFSPDGSWALVGIVSWGPPLRLYVVGGLPDEAEVTGEIDLGPEETIDCGFVGRVRITDDGRHAIAQSAWGRIHSNIADEFTLRIITDPRPGGAQVTTNVLVLPGQPILPVPPEYEGLNVGDPSVFEVLCDTDSLILPMRGNVLVGVTDQRILLVRGLHSGRLEIARILGPDDGVPITPNKPVRLPDCDRVLLTTQWAEKICIVSGLSDPTFQSVEIEAFDAPRGLISAALTADARTLLVLKPRAPFDGRPPARVFNFTVDGAVTQIGTFVGPVRAPPALAARLIATPPPGLSDYVSLCTRNLPPEVNQSLQEKIDAAVEQADLGRDGAAVEALREFRDEVQGLVRDGVLNPAEVLIFDTLVELAEQRLR